MKFNELFIKTKLLPLELGKILNDAFEKRQFGDYDVDAEISESDAMKLLENARMFLDKIKIYLMAWSNTETITRSCGKANWPE